MADSLLPKALLWRRVDVAGSEHMLYDDRGGLTARGIQLAHDPIPYRASYWLTTDERWATMRFEVTAEGAGWRRAVRLDRDADGWRVTTAEHGDLAGAQLPGIEDPDRLHAALDVDLAASPLTNTLPIRRLNLRAAPPGTTHTITTAWVLVPSLTVLPDQQQYTVLDGQKVRYTSGDFSAEIDLDGDGFVTRYETLAERA